MQELIVTVMFLVMWYFLIFLTVFYLLSGLDDLFFDIYYWVRYFVRKRAQRFKPLSYEQLVSPPEKYVAVLIPCWHEAGVIGVMLQNNCYGIDYKNYYMFVGVYPNDPKTVQEVEEIQKIMPQVQTVIGATPGPTNKAANLNGVYRYAKEFEKKKGIIFDIFVFHDSEDLIHPLSFKLYNYLIPRKEMIQIPIFPLEVSYWNFTHWLYADEFSEIHTKDIIVREAIKGHVPSAGVGTAFSRHALKMLENPLSKNPFSVDSLTEDYRTSLAIRVKGMKEIFVTQIISQMRWVKKGIFRTYYVLEERKEHIATRALFPMEYRKAVRQKSRWIIGIVFQEWLHGKWPKIWQIRYTLAHDRKSFITHFINGFGYFVFLYWILYGLLTYDKPEYPSLLEQLHRHPWVWYLIIIVTLLMFQRMLQRFIAVYRVYSLLPALLSIPRVFYGNLLNLHAILKAYKVYFSTVESTTSSKQPVWDKTDHHFPGSHILTPFHRRLGDLLLEKGLVTAEALRAAIHEQRQTGQRLGTILKKLGLLSEKDLLEILSSQYQLEIVPLSRAVETPVNFPAKLAGWLKAHEAYGLAFDKDDNTVVMGIEDPTNELLLRKLILRVAPMKAQFKLLDPES